MTNEEYQKAAHGFAQYGNNPHYPELMLAEEVGELLGVEAKFIRKHEGMDIEKAIGWETMRGDALKARDRIKGELGDILWGVSEYATRHGFTLSEIMDYNIAKLTERKETGTICGSGETVEERKANAERENAK